MEEVQCRLRTSAVAWRAAQQTQHALRAPIKVVRQPGHFDGAEPTLLARRQRLRPDESHAGRQHGVNLDEQRNLRRPRLSDAAMSIRADVTLLWGSSIVESFSIVPPRHLTSRAPAERAGCPRPRLFRKNGEVYLQIGPFTEGTLRRPGEAPQSLGDRVSGPPDEPAFIPLPVGSVAEVALPPTTSSSAYRSCPLTARIAIEPEPALWKRRVLAQWQLTLAGLVLSVAAHAAVFATEPNPVLLPTQEDLSGPRGSAADNALPPHLRSVGSARAPRAGRESKRRFKPGRQSGTSAGGSTGGSFGAGRRRAWAPPCGTTVTLRSRRS